MNTDPKVISGPCRLCGSAGVVPTCCSGSGRCSEPHWRKGERLVPTRPCPGCAARTALAFLLIHIGSWTAARWDQHVRSEYGDEIADRLGAFLEEHGVPMKEYAELRTGGRPLKAARRANADVEAPEPLPDPLPEWLWSGRVVRCAPHVDVPFEGEGAIVKHGTFGVLAKPYDGSEVRYFAPSHLEASHSGTDLPVDTADEALSAEDFLPMDDHPADPDPRARFARKCRRDCDCLCHDTGGGVHDHPGRPCPGKLPRAGERKDDPLPNERSAARPEVGRDGERQGERAAPPSAAKVGVDGARGGDGLPRGEGAVENVALKAESPFKIIEEAPGRFRVYVYHFGLVGTGSREDAERAVRSLEYDRAQTNKAANAELDDLRALLRRGVELFGDATADELAPLRERMAKGRAKYPEGCTALSLIDEAGEVAHSLNKRESVERVRDELLDVAGVAMRLYLGEIDTESSLVGLTQRGAKCRRCREPVEHGIALCASCAAEDAP